MNHPSPFLRTLLLVSAALLAPFLSLAAREAEEKPNFLVHFEASLDTPVSTRHHVVDRVLVFDSRLPRHARSLDGVGITVKF